MSMFLDLFKPRVGKQTVESQVRRFITQYIAKRNVVSQPRVESRTNMTVVVLVVPVSGDDVLVDEAFTVITKDFSGAGVALILGQPLVEQDLIIGVPCEPDPVFAKARVVHSKSVGGGFWHVGVELTSVLEDGAEMSRLRAIVRKLYP